MKKITLLASLLLGLLGDAVQAAERVVTVFAAASLTEVFEEIGKAYTRQTQVPVRFSFAGSSALARQIEAGAPAEVFASADQEWMDYLARRQLLRPATRTDIASNSLVLVAPAGSKLQLKIAPRFAIAGALGRSGRLATGNPDTVPAGKYAKEALVQLGVWDSIAARVIPADNVRSALNFVALGEAPLGIVYATDARGNARVRVVDTFPAGSHAPITYPAAATIRGGAEAVAFVQFLRSPAAQAIFNLFGFATPEDSRRHP